MLDLEAGLLDGRCLRDFADGGKDLIEARVPVPVDAHKIRSSRWSPSDL